jgi:hypothetical protein
MYDERWCDIENRFDITWKGEIPPLDAIEIIQYIVFAWKMMLYRLPFEPERVL